MEMGGFSTSPHFPLFIPYAAFEEQLFATGAFWFCVLGQVWSLEAMLLETLLEVSSEQRTLSLSAFAVDGETDVHSTEASHVLKEIPIVGRFV